MIEVVAQVQALQVRSSERVAELMATSGLTETAAMTRATQEAREAISLMINRFGRPAMTTVCQHLFGPKNHEHLQ